VADLDMECNFQKVSAEKAMQCIRGVKAVANLIEVAPAASPANIQKGFEEAPRRIPEIDARQIKVTTRDHPAVLSGNVRSRSEGEEAERAAWSVAGVVRVGDLIVV
jgi:osmotically-inducible protein OsmY